MSVITYCRGSSFTTFHCPQCGIEVNLSDHKRVFKSRKHEVRISIDEEAVKEKLVELEKNDFYKKAVAYKRQRHKMS